MRSQDKISSTYPLTDEEATKIAIEAYLYASAIVQMEVHRRVLTNQEASDGKQMRGPMNQFAHLRNFPDAQELGSRRPELRHALLVSVVRRVG